MPEPFDKRFVRELKFSTTQSHDAPVGKVLLHRLLGKQSAGIHLQSNEGLNFVVVVDVGPASAEISNQNTFTFEL